MLRVFSRQLFLLAMLFVFLTSTFGDAAEIKSVEGDGIEVLSTITPTQQQQENQERPSFHQPVDVEGKPQPTTLPLSLDSGETLVFVGNGLAERMEHYNYFETLLYRAFPTQSITFRNLGFPGHTAGFRPDSGNDHPWAFPNAEKYIAATLGPKAILKDVLKIAQALRKLAPNLPMLLEDLIKRATL